MPTARRWGRLEVIDEMNLCRNTMKAVPVTAEEIVHWIRADRDGGH